MKKILFTILAPALALSMFSVPARAACGEVVITEMNWASATVVTTVAKFIMEQGYKCKVTVVPSSTVPSVASVAETGQPDIVTELWLNSAPLYSELEAQGKVKTAGKILSDGGEEGWWIPKYLADKHPELTTIDGVFANPELVGGRFNNCPSGWGCRVHNDNLIKAFDMESKGIEVFNHGSGETLATSIASAYVDEQPWFGYYWAPTAILGKYPMVMVDLGPYDADISACNGKVDCATPGITSFAAAPVLTGVTTDFAQREPEIFDLMSKMTYSNKVMNEVLAWQESNNSSAGEAAAYFLRKYKNIWSGWLNDDARNNLAALL